MVIDRWEYRTSASRRREKSSSAVQDVELARRRVLPLSIAKACELVSGRRCRNVERCEGVMG